MVTKQLIIAGKVQGVFFRKSAKEKAKELKLNGWIKNLNDGNVIALVQGSESGINYFIEWSRRGPSNAVVSNVEIMDIASGDHFDGFEIIH